MILRILKPLPAPHSECEPGSVVNIHDRYGRKLIARGLCEVATDDHLAEVVDIETAEVEAVEMVSDEVEDIIAAIEGLDANDDSLFFNDGRPKVKGKRMLRPEEKKRKDRDRALALLGAKV